MNLRAQNAISFTAIITAAAMGVVGLPVWTSAICCAVLAVLATLRQAKLRHRFSAVGASELLLTAHAASFMNALLTAVAAWGVGALLREVLLAFA
jgi:hypothetical protein